MATADLLSMNSKKSADKQKALDSALAQIERQFGKGSIMKLGTEGAVQDIKSSSTGSLGLDIALGIGGLPMGRIVEIYGPESSGKTTLLRKPPRRTMCSIRRGFGVAGFLSLKKHQRSDYLLGAHDSVCLALTTRDQDAPK